MHDIEKKQQRVYKIIVVFIVTIFSFKLTNITMKYFGIFSDKFNDDCQFLCIIVNLPYYLENIFTFVPIYFIYVALGFIITQLMFPNRGSYH